MSHINVLENVFQYREQGQKYAAKIFNIVLKCMSRAKKIYIRHFLVVFLMFAMMVVSFKWLPLLFNAF